MFRDVPHEMWTTLLHGSLSGDLKSHRDRKLTDHLCGTARLAQELVRRHKLDDLAVSICAAAYTHDLGKAHPDFQKRLRGVPTGLKTEHSAPSAFFTHSLKPKGCDSFELFLSAEAVRRHHTKIEDWENLMSNYWQQFQESAVQINEDIKNLIPHWPCLLEEKEWKTLIRKCARIGAYQGDPMEDYWFFLRSILSLLVAADRMNAIGVEELNFSDFPALKPSKTWENTPMNDWRREIAEACRKNVDNVVAPGLFTLTLPTGAGKTRIGLQAAHVIARKLDYETIIYALPFISIVEQNAKVAGELFGNDAVQEDHSLALADTEVPQEARDNNNDSNKKNRGYDWERMSHLFRYWNAPVVVTTLVQLWDAIYNPKANATMDFHRLSKAVVLLDEPQSIDGHLWHGFGETLEFLCRKLGTVFILMTATQPCIIRQGAELAPPCVTLPFKRHRYRFLPGKHELKDLPGLLKEYTPFDQTPGMVVLNTRRAVLTVYDMMKKLLSDAPVFVLTGWMTPVHRRKALKEIKRLEQSGERYYLISTQVVEAGVDLDFDWVFRDIGPMDSVIQVAGRCNRSALKGLGYVLIAELCDEKRNTFSKIYDDVLVNKTREILTGTSEFDEHDVTDLVSRYYKSVSRDLCPANIWKNIREGLWGDYTPLIKDQRQELMVYVDEDGGLDEILETLQSTKRTLDNREHLKVLENRLQQHSFSVAPKFLEEWRNRGIGSFIGGEEALEAYGDLCYIIRPSGIGEDKVYHPVAGFQPPESSTDDDLYGG